MRDATQVRRRAPLGIAVVLVLCAVSGLAAGGLARGLGQTSHTGAPTHTATKSVASSSSTPGAPQATNTAATSTLPATPFTLTLAVTPRAAAPGQALLVTVTARNDANGGPVSKLSCTLRAPRDGAQPLMQTWPAPAITGSDGMATWQVPAPASPGRYELEVYAQGQHGLYYMYDTSVVVSS